MSNFYLKGKTVNFWPSLFQVSESWPLNFDQSELSCLNVAEKKLLRGDPTRSQDLSHNLVKNYSKQYMSILKLFNYIIHIKET